MRKELLNHTVSDNKLVLILPFQFLNNWDRNNLQGFGSAYGKDPQNIPEAINVLKNYEGKELKSLLGLELNDQCVWEQRSDCGNYISEDLYPVAQKILFGDSEEKNIFTGCQQFKLNPSISQHLKDLWVDGLKLPSKNDAQLIKLDFDDVSMYLLGSGIGLLSVRLIVDLLEESGKLNVSDFLKSVHFLTQSPKKNEDKMRLVKVKRMKNVEFDYMDLEFIEVKDGDKTKKSKLAKEQHFFKPYKEAGNQDKFFPINLKGNREEVIIFKAVLGFENLKPDSIALNIYGHKVKSHATTGIENEPKSDLLQWLLSFIPTSESGKYIFKGLSNIGTTDSDNNSSLRDDYVTSRIFSYTAIQLNRDGLVEFDSAELTDLAYRISSHFDENYAPHPEVFKTSVFQPFISLFHGVSTQGASLVINPKDNDNFLKTYLNDTLVKAYYPIALINFHEYIYLLSLVQGAAIYPSQVKYGNDGYKLELLRNQLIRFRLFYRFSQISNINLHNKVLKLWREQLGLDYMLEELARDVAEADKQIKLYLNSNLKQKEKENETRWQLITAFGSFAGFFFLISSAISLHVDSSIPQQEITLKLKELDIRLMQYEKLLKGENDAPKQEYQNFQLPSLISPIDLSNSSKGNVVTLPKDLEVELCSEVNKERRNIGQEKFCNETSAMREDIEKSARWTRISFWLTISSSLALTLILIQLRFGLVSSSIRKYLKILNKKFTKSKKNIA